MPQTAQHSLVQVLLLWITILSIIQVVFITLFFTQDKSQNCTAVDPARAMLSTTDNKPSSDPLQLGKVKMLTFTASNYPANGKVEWIPHNSPTGLLSVNNEVLTIEKDGFYFINLQVNLKECKKNPPPGGIEVCLKLTNSSNVTRDILQGRINPETCSTGLLAKVVGLSEGTLEVVVNQKTFQIDDKQSLTHLDVIFVSLK